MVISNTYVELLKECNRRKLLYTVSHKIHSPYQRTMVTLKGGKMPDAHKIEIEFTFYNEQEFLPSVTYSIEKIPGVVMNYSYGQKTLLELLAITDELIP